MRNKIITGKTIWLGFLLALYFTSCVTKRKTILMQPVDSQVLIKDTGLTHFKPHFNVYKVRPGDILSLEILSVNKGKFNFETTEKKSGAFPEELIGNVITDSGFIKIPYVGNVKIAGYTLQQAENIVNEKVNELFPNSFTSLRYAGFNITFLGDFNSTGRKRIPTDKINIYEAIALGGDFTRLANRSKVKILRSAGDSTIMYTLDLRNRNIINSEFFYLYPNDILYAEPLTIRLFTDNTTAIQVVSYTLGFIVSLINLYLIFTKIQ